MAKDTTRKSESQQQQTQQAFATPEEQAFNKAEQERLGRMGPGEEQAQMGAFNLINALLTGGSLPGFLGGLPGGISPETIGTQAARTAKEAQPGFQSLGIADSGVAFRETAEDVAENVLFPAEQFNLTNLANLLGIGLSGQSALQSQTSASRANLGSRLAGLRQMTGSGSQSGTTTTIAPNPFLQTFQSSLGKTLGSPSFGSGPFTFGG